MKRQGGVKSRGCLKEGTPKRRDRLKGLTGRQVKVGHGISGGVWLKIRQGEHDSFFWGGGNQLLSC